MLVGLNVALVKLVYKGVPGGILSGLSTGDLPEIDDGDYNCLRVVLSSNFLMCFGNDVDSCVKICYWN